VLSLAANLLYHWVAGAPHESTTNFRVFSCRAAEAVLARARGRDFEFQPEAALLVLAAGFKVREVPIVFTNRVRGSSKLGKKQAIKALVFFVTATVQYRLRVGRFAPSFQGRTGSASGSFNCRCEAPRSNLGRWGPIPYPTRSPRSGDSARDDNDGELKDPGSRFTPS
jgi:hypothetical protein